MLKGVSKQVIVVQSPDAAFFEQAIFILKEGTPEVTDQILLEQANRLIRESKNQKPKTAMLQGSVFALVGAAATGLLWLFSVIL